MTHQRRKRHNDDCPDCCRDRTGEPCPTCGPDRAYQLRTLERAEAVEDTRAKKRRLQKEILVLFGCPRCGTDTPPFLDYFALDLEIECECGQKGELRDFLEVDR